MNRNEASLLGLAGAAIVPPAFLALMFPITGTRDLGSIAVSFFIFFWYSGIAIVVIGTPTFLVLHRFGFVNWWTAALFGFAAGAAIALFLTSNGEPYLEGVLWLGAMGAAAALIFVAAWRRAK